MYIQIYIYIYIYIYKLFKKKKRNFSFCKIFRHSLYQLHFYTTKYLQNSVYTIFSQITVLNG